MQVKRYHAQNVQDALRSVRRELGPDALVVSTRLVAARGPRGWFGGRVVELTAAASRTPLPEIRSGGEPSRRDSCPDRAVEQLPERLTAARASTPPAGAQPARLPERCAAAVAARLSAFAAGDRDHAPIEVFIGPPGSGKSTTVAKIAARERARAGVRFGLATLDASQHGAIDGMRLHAGVIGAPLVLARSAYELQTVLETSEMPLLVDTSGRDTADVRVDEVLRLVAAWPEARVHLVIPAGLPIDAMRGVWRRHAAGRPARVVVTKVDEAASLDAIAVLLREARVPVSYACAGPRVPEDLLPMTTSGSRARWIS